MEEIGGRDGDFPTIGSSADEARFRKHLADGGGLSLQLIEGFLELGAAGRGGVRLHTFGFFGAS